MATIYIATIGNDTTGDGSVGNPYATTTKGVSVAVSGDTISVAGGTYNNEKFSTGDKSLTFTATGTVIWDGTHTTASPAVTINTTTGGRSVTFNVSGSGSWELKRYTSASTLIYGNPSSVLTVSLNKMTFTCTSNLYGYYINYAGTAQTTTINQCIFSGFNVSSSAYGLYIATTQTGSTIQITNNTFTNCYTTAALNAQAGTTFSGNTVTNCALGCYRQGSGLTAANNTYTDVYGWANAAAAGTWSAWKAAGYDVSGSTSNTLGLTWYVNKSGSDANTGYGPNNAKLTIQAGINASTLTDAIIVGSGLYNEKLSYTYSSTVYHNLYADGNVVLDGSGLGNFPLVTLIQSGASTPGCGILPYTTGGSWTFQNCGNSTTGIISIQGAANTTPHIFANCKLISSSNLYGIYSSDSALSIYNCIFYGFSNTGIYIANTSGVYTGNIITLNNNTIYNCGTGIYHNIAANSTTSNIYNNIISTCTTGVRLGGSTAPAAINIQNNQYFNITNWKYMANTDTVFATWQGRLTNLDLGSLGNTDPNFEDAANNIFYLKSASSLSRIQGAIPFGYATGSNAGDLKWKVVLVADNSGWYSPDGNIAIDGTTNAFQMVGGTTAQLYSPVIDFASTQTVRGINLGVQQTWPVSMIDTTNTDTKPNYQTVEIRASNSSFTQNDGVVTWYEVKTEQPINPISGRYFQLRITFRVNGTGA